MCLDRPVPNLNDQVGLGMAGPTNDEMPFYNGYWVDRSRGQVVIVQHSLCKAGSAQVEGFRRNSPNTSSPDFRSMNQAANPSGMPGATSQQSGRPSMAARGEVVAESWLDKPPMLRKKTMCDTVIPEVS